MLSYSYWKRRFGGDPSVEGSVITVDTSAKEILGVMHAGFRIVDADTDLIFPLEFDRERITLGAGFINHGDGRLKQLDANLARIRHIQEP